MSTPSIKVGQGNWGIKAGNLLGYANTEKKFAPIEFTSSRALDTATRVNASGDIEIVNANIPRIDYFGGQASLLVEPSGTNLLLQSEAFNTTWTRSSGGTGLLPVITANDTVSPDGNQTADKIDLSLSSGNTLSDISWIYQNNTLSSGQIYAGSVWLKAATQADVGKVIQVGYVSYQSYTLTADWARITLTQTPSSTGNYSFGFRLRGAQGTANSASFYAWGAQLETGSVATSYIPTTTGSVTRNADSISVTGVAGLIGQTEGTIYLETDKLMDATLERFFSIYSSTSPTNDNIIISKTTSNTINFAIRKNNVLSTYVANFSGTVLKLACAFNASSSGVAIYVNGVQLLIDTNSGSFASALDEVYIGRLRPSVNTDNLYNGRIHAAALYTTRLTNAQLEYLTSFASYEEMASTLSYTLI